jgi:hypothetical protein
MEAQVDGLTNKAQTRILSNSLSNPVYVFRPIIHGTLAINSLLTLIRY